MKFSAIIVASLFAGALSAPVEKQGKVVTVTEEVIHVVTATTTIWILPSSVENVEKGGDKENVVTPTPKPVVSSLIPTPASPTPTPVITPTPEPIIEEPEEEKEEEKEEPVEEEPIEEEPIKEEPPKEEPPKEEPPKEEPPKEEPTPIETPVVTPVPSKIEPAPIVAPTPDPIVDTSGSNSGEGTFYDPSIGFGSCGTVESDTDYVAAISHIVMDSRTINGNTNGNPLCGKKIKVNYGTETVTVRVVDRCPVCAAGDIDLSGAAFEKLAHKDLGRIKITWDWL